MGMALHLGRVLLVEDEDGVAEAIRFGLLAAGASEVVVATDGNLGVALARAETFDLIVCDLVLPGLDGLQVSRRLREAGSTTPLVFLSAATGYAFRTRKPEDYGAIGALTKPVDIRKLGEQLREILATRP